MSCEDRAEDRVDERVGRLNHSWNESRSWNMSGRMKLRRDQSSAKLFWDEDQYYSQGWNSGYKLTCNGVPLKINLPPLFNCLISLISRQSKFFNRWPSSTTM